MRWMCLDGLCMQGVCEHACLYVCMLSQQHSAQRWSFSIFTQHRETEKTWSHLRRSGSPRSLRWYIISAVAVKSDIFTIVDVMHLVFDKYIPLKVFVMMSSIFIVYLDTKKASVVFILSRIHLIETLDQRLGRQSTQIFWLKVFTVLNLVKRKPVYNLSQT